MQTVNHALPLIIIVCALFLSEPCPLSGQVKESAADGFAIETTRAVNMDSARAYETFVGNFSKWYNADHSYTGKAENLSLDLDRHCMLEKLPGGGFVRHMEIVFHQPGKTFRMTGGLGPLQGMGVSGALTFSFEEKKNQTHIKMTYVVSGASFLKLDTIAEPVSAVLKDQMDRLQKHCHGPGESAVNE